MSCGLCLRLWQLSKVSQRLDEVIGQSPVVPLELGDRIGLMGKSCEVQTETKEFLLHKERRLCLSACGLVPNERLDVVARHVDQVDILE